MKRVEVNDIGAINLLATNYLQWEFVARLDNGIMEKGRKNLVPVMCIITWVTFIVKGEISAMACHEVARYNLACVEYNSGNIERALNHWIIAASAGGYHAMHALRISFEQGHVSRDSMESTLIAYYNSCAKMISEARDANIRKVLEMRWCVLIFPKKEKFT
jgi:hypothetical protein